jgi:hypothetical protein
MAADASLTARIAALAALFNRKSLDLPDGLFDRRTQFLLNGTPFEAMLGRSSSDPLVLMIARGPAGYRFAVKALHHAVPDARIDPGTIEGMEDGRGNTEDGKRMTEHGGSSTDPIACTVPLWLSGHLRGTGAPIEVVIRVTATFADDIITRADVRIDPAALEPIREARLRE